MTGQGPKPRSDLRIVAVVPLYRPDAGQFDNVRSHLEQVDAVVAVDDGSGPSFANAIDSLATEKVRVEMLPCNSGIAAALNAGVRVALNEGATHILTIDQDSRLGQEYVGKALRTLESLDLMGTCAGAVGAGIVGDSRLRGKELGAGVRNGVNSIQSGWLVPRATFELVGQFDEQLFIDCVDTDFAIRCELARRHIVITDECAIEHQLGLGERRSMTVRGRGAFASHPPLRRYYITRNRLLLLARYGRRRPRLLVRQTIRESRIALSCLIVGPARGRQARAIVRGIVDAALGRIGRVDSSLAARLQA
jgi:rhamnosyltransferase